VRVALIGPVGRSESQLDRALDLTFTSLLADRALYLGDPDLVSRRRLLSAPSADDSLWTRSLACVYASHDEIDRFVAAERRNLDWARLELPETGGQSIGLSRDRALFVALDGLAKSQEAEAAALLVSALNGSGGEFLVEEQGDGRLHLSPGSLDDAGLIVVSDESELAVEVYDLDGVQLSRRVLPSPDAA
jgi:hypothetical protein